uniref:Uncharacterized protein n=1 Tax=Ciona savignyi TaxID=51511 RepID=H2YC79_CIOSA
MTSPTTTMTSSTVMSTPETTIRPTVAPVPLGTCEAPNVCQPPRSVFDVTDIDVPYRRGCSYREMARKHWLCSSLFFNEYPYVDNNKCR